MTSPWGRRLLGALAPKTVYAHAAAQRLAVRDHVRADAEVFLRAARLQAEAAILQDEQRFLDHELGVAVAPASRIVARERLSRSRAAKVPALRMEEVLRYGIEIADALQASRSAGAQLLLPQLKR